MITVATTATSAAPVHITALDMPGSFLAPLFGLVRFLRPAVEAANRLSARIVGVRVTIL
jgi:hypothetical protein